MKQFQLKIKLKMKQKKILKNKIYSEFFFLFLSSEEENKHPDINFHSFLYNLLVNYCPTKTQFLFLLKLLAGNKWI